MPCDAAEDQIKAVNAGVSPIQVLVMDFKVSGERLNTWFNVAKALTLEPNTSYQRGYQG